MSWRPLLEGADADAARAAIATIADELAGRELDDGSLAHGAAGVALVHGYLARAGDDAAAARAHAALARSLAALDEGPLTPWLGTGFVGTAWVMHDLSDVVALDGETLAQIDGLVSELLTRPSSAFEVDHWAGLVGVGAYALERARLDLVERVVAHLEGLAEPDADGLSWRRRDRPARAPDGYVDVGMAHGVAGVTAFVTAAAEAGIARARALAGGGARWLLARDRGGACPRFPMAIGLEVRAEQVCDGWCYGDAAIAAALRRAGALLGEAAWIARGGELARGVADAAIDHAPHFDAGLCHGAASRMFALAHLAHAFDDAHLADAARSYAHEAMSRVGTETRASLLVGTSGVALALLAALSTAEPGWARLFLY